MRANARAATDLMVLMMATLSGIATVILAVLAGTTPGLGFLRLSAAAIVLTPAGALTWCYRDQQVMPVAARAVLAAFGAIDLILLIGLLRHPLREAVDPGSAAAILIWGTLWLFWQFLTLAAALSKPRSR